MARKPDVEQLEKRLRELEDDLRQTRDALFTSDQLFRAVFASVRDSIFIKDRSFRFVKANPALLAVLGVSENDVVGKTDDDLFGAEAGRFIREIDRRVLAGETIDKVYPGKLVQGEKRHFHTVKAPLRGAGGDIVGILGIARDITDHIAMERAQHASERKYRALFEQSADAIFLHDLEGNILDVNKAALSQGNYSREKLLEMSVFDLLPDPSMSEDIKRQWRQWPDEKIAVIEHAHRRADGAIYPVEIKTSKVRFNHGQMMLAVVRDLTEQKKLQEEQKNLQAQLIQAQKMESVGRLAGGVAHDYNNMLSVILGYTELALGKLAETDPLRADLQAVLSAAERSSAITRQLLAFSRQQPIAPEPFDLNDAVAGALKMLNRLIGENIDLAWHPAADRCPVSMDPSQLDQILMNLCVNARDAIVDVGKITIQTGVRSFDDAYCMEHYGFEPGDFVWLTVSDTGRGMDKETRERLYEPFFTTKEKGRGTGLGLATVYGIVKQNNGFINVYSEVDHGTRFTIYLPRRRAAPQDRQREERGGRDRGRGQ